MTAAVAYRRLEDVIDAERNPPRPDQATLAARVRKATQGLRVIDWIETHCVFTNGEWIGKPFRLLAWQRTLILELFEVDPATGLRKHRWAYLSVPKKNGKTELAAALALYLLIGDEEPAPLVVCAAASDDQADLVFGAAKRMCELSPTLRAVTEGGRFEKEIQVPSIPGAVLRRVAAVAGTNDGQNIHAVICDELHEWVGTKGENVWNVLTNGLGARRQPMVIQTTTAGFDLETVCGRQYEYAQAVRRGEIDDPRYYSFIAEGPADVDWRELGYWQAANPSFGETVHPTFFEDQLKKGESVFRRYFGNQWVEAETVFVPESEWRLCYAPKLELQPDQPTWVGVDFAHYHDATAVVWAQRFTAGGKERIVVRARFWQNPYPPSDARHERWVVPTAEVEDHLRWLYREYPTPTGKLEAGGRLAPGPVFYCDPARFQQSMATLLGERLNIQKITQSDERMIPVAQDLAELVMTHVIAHDGDPTLTSHLKNTSRDPRPRGGFRMSKPKTSRKRIDGAIALGLAAHGALQKPAKRARFYSF